MPGSWRSWPITASHTSRMKLKKDLSGKPLEKPFSCTPFAAYQAWKSISR